MQDFVWEIVNDVLAHEDGIKDAVMTDSQLICPSRFPSQYLKLIGRDAADACISQVQVFRQLYNGECGMYSLFNAISLCKLVCTAPNDEEAARRIANDLLRPGRFWTSRRKYWHWLQAEASRMEADDRNPDNPNRDESVEEDWTFPWGSWTVEHIKHGGQNRREMWPHSGICEPDVGREHIKYLLSTLPEIEALGGPQQFEALPVFSRACFRKSGLSIAETKHLASLIDELRASSRAFKAFVVGAGIHWFCVAVTKIDSDVEITLAESVNTPLIGHSLETTKNRAKMDLLDDKEKFYHRLREDCTFRRNQIKLALVKYEEFMGKPVPDWLTKILDEGSASRNRPRQLSRTEADELVDFMMTKYESEWLSTLEDARFLLHLLSQTMRFTGGKGFIATNMKMLVDDIVDTYWTVGQKSDQPGSMMIWFENSWHPAVLENTLICRIKEFSGQMEAETLERLRKWCQEAKLDASNSLKACDADLAARFLDVITKVEQVLL